MALRVCELAGTLGHRDRKGGETELEGMAGQEEVKACVNIVL